MLSVLLIDDEDLELDGLENMIQGMGLDIEVCGKARSAQEGIALAKQLSPNVILSDVKMPGMDGIEMARSIRNAGIKSFLAFISGYQDFTAAQKAIDLGAQAYMLKPVNCDNLKNILLSAGSARLSRINAEQEKQRLSSRLKKLDDIEREAFIKNLLFLPTSKPQSEIIEDAHRLGITLTTGKYAVMTVNFRVLPAMRDEDFFMMLSGLCVAHNALPPVRDRLGQAAVLFNFPDFLNEEQIMEHLETAGEAMLSAYSIQGVGGVCIGVSEISAQLTKAYLLAEQSRSALRQSFLKGMGCVLFYEETNTATKVPYNLSEHMRAILAAVSDGDPQQSDFLTLTLFADWDACTTRETVQGACVDILSSALNMCREAKLANPLHEDSEALLYTKLLGLQTHEETCVFMLDFLRDISGIFFDYRNNQGIQLVERIEKIIEIQYNKQISIEDIAAQVYLSPSYVRRVFKNRTGVTLSGYLQSVRLSKALELMRQPQYKIYEIGSLVGYENPSYFTMVFKKTYGSTPGAYREKLNIYERQ